MNNLREKTMTDKSEDILEFDINEINIKMISLSAPTFANVYRNSIPILEDHMDSLFINTTIDDNLNIKVGYPHLYAALKYLFGKSTTLYDEYKCSFGYKFLLIINNDSEKMLYLFEFVDIKGGLCYRFSKPLLSRDEEKMYSEKSVLREPLDDIFSRKEMASLKKSFLLYLITTFISIKDSYDEEFIRSNPSRRLIYGYKDGSFFTDTYDSQEKFYDKICNLEENSDIPLNMNRPNK